MQCCASPARSAREVGITGKTSLKTKKDFCGNHCRKSPMRSIDDGGPAALHNASDQARCNPATLYPASKNDHQPPQRNNRSCLVLSTHRMHPS